MLIINAPVSCLEARIDGQPLTLDQKRAHATLLIIAGADTTATTLGCTMRFLMKNPAVLARVRAELATAESAGRLSTPIQHEETRENLPFFVACVKESIRLNPSAAQLFGRVAPAGGVAVDGKWIPGGSEMTSLSYVVHRDPVLYAPDPEVYRPERWLEGEAGGNTKEVLAEMEAASFGFGMGPRVCMGRDIAMMEIYKLIPEVSSSVCLCPCCLENFMLTNPGCSLSAGSILRWNRRAGMWLSVAWESMRAYWLVYI